MGSRKANAKRGNHCFNIGEEITLIDSYEVSGDNGEKVMWYDFKNEDGLFQILIKSEFEWIEEV